MLPSALEAEHGDQQGADAEIWGREPVQVSGRILGLTRHVTSPLVSLRASTDRKTKETVALELSFVNSNLQLLKEQLAELNSSVEVKSVNLVGFLHLKNIEGVPSRAGRPPASGANDPPRSEGDEGAGAGGGVQGVDREPLLRGRGRL